MVYGVDENLTDSEAVKHWKNKFKTFSPIEPKQIENGPVKENVMVGRRRRPDEISVAELAPTGRRTLYLRNGGVTRDPDSGYINVGSYRYMLLGKNPSSRISAPAIMAT